MNELTITGELLQKLRQLKNVTQQMMAMSLGISQPRYWEIEKKKVIGGELLASLMEILEYSSTEVERLKRTLPPPPENELAGYRLANAVGRYPLKKCALYSRLNPKATPAN